MELEGKLSQLQIQLNSREQELNKNYSKVCELTKDVNRLELNGQRYKHERDLACEELEREKELCNKLDNEIEKLNAEVQEYSEIRRDVN